MKIRSSKYNEVRFDDVKSFIKTESQIVKGDDRLGKFLGIIYWPNNAGHTAVYSTDYVIIDNVRLALAYAEDSYFDCYISIN